MGCGDCQGTLDALRQELVELRSVLTELRDEYLALARDYDRMVELHGKGEAENEDE